MQKHTKARQRRLRKVTAQRLQVIHIAPDPWRPEGCHSHNTALPARTACLKLHQRDHGCEVLRLLIFEVSSQLFRDENGNQACSQRHLARTKRKEDYTLQNDTAQISPHFYDVYKASADHSNKYNTNFELVRPGCSQRSCGGHGFQVGST